MSRGPATFRKADLKRAFKAASAAGVEVQRVEVSKDGTISIITGASAGQPDKQNPQNPWDEVLTDAAHEKRAP
jgi:hypothetical protein